MSTSRWNLLPLRMFRGLPACAQAVMGSPVMGLGGATHIPCAWAVKAKLQDRRKAKRNGKRRRGKSLDEFEGDFGCSRRVYCLWCYYFYQSFHIQ